MEGKWRKTVRVLEEKRKGERPNGISTHGGGNTLGGSELVMPFRIGGNYRQLNKLVCMYVYIYNTRQSNN